MKKQEGIMENYLLTELIVTFISDIWLLFTDQSPGNYSDRPQVHKERVIAMKERDSR